MGQALKLSQPSNSPPLPRKLIIVYPLTLPQSGKTRFSELLTLALSHCSPQTTLRAVSYDMLLQKEMERERASCKSNISRNELFLKALKRTAAAFKLEIQKALQAVKQDEEGTNLLFLDHNFTLKSISEFVALTK